eukprot:scaffold521556_cov48-Prasinocladus_malaysianus.AAC.1
MRLANSLADARHLAGSGDCRHDYLPLQRDCNPNDIGAYGGSERNVSHRRRLLLCDLEPHSV